MAASGSTIPVLVVGAGPTGLSLALELARRGVTCRLVEQMPRPSSSPRATELHGRTLEVWDQAGLADAVLSEALVVDGVAYYAGGRCIGVQSYAAVDSPFPVAAACPQQVAERLLAAAFEAHGGRVERGRGVVGLESRDDGVVAMLRDPDGAEERVQAEWLVACDGVRSAVRQMLGIAFVGGDYPPLYASVDALVDGWPYPRQQQQIFLDSTEQWVGPLPGGWLRTAYLRQGDAERPTIAELQGVLDQHVPGTARVREIAHPTYFRWHHRLASAYRHGRALLAGDAAHVVSPLGGTGLNTGVQDAANLAWKLALVCSGAAPPALLDSYEAERRPVARAAVRATDAMFASQELVEPQAVETRNRQLAVQLNSPLAQLATAEAVHGLRVSYRHSPIVVGHRASGPGRGRHRLAWTGPAPGDRAYAPGSLVTASGATTSLRALLRGTAHQLLVLAGEADAATISTYVALAATAVARFGRWLEAHVVVVADRPPPRRVPGVDLLADPELVVHGHLGVIADTLCLIRPDGYLGLRAEPPDADRLADYFAALGVTAAG